MALPVWRGLSLCQSSGRPRTFLACETFATRASATGIDMNWWFMKFSKKPVPKMPEKPKEVPFQCVTVQQQPPLFSPNWNATVPVKSVNCLSLGHFDKFSECVSNLALVLLLPLPSCCFAFSKAMPAAQHREGLAASCLTLGARASWLVHIVLKDSDPQFVAKSN